MKNGFRILVALLAFGAVFAGGTVNTPNKQVYSKIRFQTIGDDNSQVIFEFGLDPECTKIDKAGALETILPAEAIDELKHKVDNLEILIPDMEQYYLGRYAKFDANTVLADEDFKYGSMGGFFTLKEMYAELDLMILNYKQYFTGADTIGRSAGGNPIVAYHFGSTDAGAPQILITNLIHAREPGGMTTSLYFLKRALRQAEEGDTEFTYLFGNRSVYYIPAVNPDGYLYNEEISPEGGGMWRKNTRKTSDTTLGVDLNRNFGPYDFWNSSNLGSSTKPKDATYRGPYPFSEPETQALRQFAMKQKFDIVINNHTFGGYLVHPNSALGIQTADSAIFRAFCSEFTKENFYSYGLDLETVGYGVRGDSDDWFYTEDSLKQKTFAITPEIGNQNDGFWPPIERIPEQCRENFDMYRQALWSAGANIRLKGWKPDCNENKMKSFITLAIINAGTRPAAQESELHLKSLDSAFEISGNSKIVSKLAPAEKEFITFEVAPTGLPFTNGAEVPFEVKIVQDGIERTDTITEKMLLYRELPLFVKGEFSHEWAAIPEETWGTVFDPVINSFVLTDSPKGLSRDTSDVLLQISEPLNIPCLAAVLDFDAHWSVESYYDKFIIQARTEGADWANLISGRMTQGIGVDGSRIDSLEWAFSGNQPEWLRLECSLAGYINNDFYLRFGVMTDRAKAFDGVFLDNIRIRYYPDFAVYNVDDNNGRGCGNVFPNPVWPGGRCIISSEGTGDITGIFITDMNGRKVNGYNYRVSGNNIVIEIIDLECGVYVASVFAGNSIKPVKIVIAGP